MMWAALWLVVALGGAMALFVARALWEERPGGVAVLLYHRLRKESEWPDVRGAERHFSVPEGRFRAQLEAMREAGWTFIGLPEVYGIVRGERPAPPRAACLTFDDGSESVHRLALPILRELAAPAAVFVTTSPQAWVFEDQARLSDDQLAQLLAAGVWIGAHGVSHRGLNGLPDAELDAELRQSRAALEALLEIEVRDMAIPLNFYDARVLAACRHADYRMVLTADPGHVRAGSPPGRLRRVAVEGTMSPAELLSNLRPTRLAQRKIVAWLKRVPPRLLGEDRWMPLRARIFASPIGRLLTFRHLRVLVLAAAAVWLAALIALILATQQ